MRMNLLRIVIILVVALLNINIGEAQASEFSGGYLGAKMGANTSKATDSNGATVVSNERTAAYFMQGGYLQGGYNLDLSAVVVGVGAYYDWNAYVKHFNGVGYGSRSSGFDVKLGVPIGNWIPYAKIGRGRNAGTDDFSAIKQISNNSALGFEYKLASHWSTVGEYKINKFSSQDGAITIHNKTVALGLNYYFDEPPAPEAVAPEPEQEPIPELAPMPEPVGPEPTDPAPPSPAPVSPPEPAPVSEVWKSFMEEKAVSIEGTNFARGSAKLELKAGKELMKDVVEFVGAHPEAHLELIGYTDSKGSEKLNKKLSLARAQAVKQYLVDTGIAADRITVHGAGSSNPVADNNTLEGRAKNRRVEIRSVIKEEKKVRVTG
jgi:OmpA-OmpF porin, OOP family